LIPLLSNVRRFIAVPRQISAIYTDSCATALHHLYYAQQVLGRTHIIAAHPVIIAIGNATIRAVGTYGNANTKSIIVGYKLGSFHKDIVSETVHIKQAQKGKNTEPKCLWKNEMCE
jgi:hypothetical protein